MEDTKIRLSALWISHFLLWTFGDMLGLLQQSNDPVDENLLLFVAAPLAILQTIMILLPLMMEYKTIRITNLVVSPIFLLLNIMNFIDVDTGAQYLLTAVYVIFNLLIMKNAWQWSPKIKSD